MSDEHEEAAKAFGDPDAPDGRLRIPRVLTVLAVATGTVALLAGAALVLAGSEDTAKLPSAPLTVELPSAPPTAEPAPEPARTGVARCVTLWNRADAATLHQVAAGFRRVGDVRVRVTRANGRCRVSIGSELAGQTMRFTQVQRRLPGLGAYSAPELRASGDLGDANAEVRPDGTLR